MSHPRFSQIAQMQGVSIITCGDGETLLVPAEDMWHVHEAATPEAICERAEVRSEQYRLLTAAVGDPLPEWFYSRSEDPVYANGKYLRPTREMKQFRKQARIRSILRAASKSEARRAPVKWRKDRNHDIRENSVHYWLSECKGINGFKEWLLRGAPLPNVTIATLDQIERCKRAWDYTTFCRRAGIATGTYIDWFQGRRTPKGKRKSEKTRALIPNLRLLHWLFGADPPAGVFVVVEKLQNLRGENGRKRIAAAAQTELAQFSQWEHSAKWKKFISAALAGNNPAHIKGWAELTKLCRQRMTMVYEAALPENCRQRAGFATDSEYEEVLAEAECLGARHLLDDYLAMRGKFEDESIKRGLMATNFLIPTRDMLEFRKIAKAARDEARIAAFEREPWFDAWFHAWTKPQGWKCDHVPPARRGPIGANGQAQSEASLAGNGRHVTNRGRPSKKYKDSTAKVLAALNAYHEFDGDSIGNSDPAKNITLANEPYCLTGNALTRFLQAKLGKKDAHKKYVAMCLSGRLCDVLLAWNGETPGRYRQANLSGHSQ